MYFAGILVSRYRCAMSWCNFGVIFHLVLPRIYSTGMFEIYFSHHKAIWIAAIDYYIYIVYLTVLSALTVILQLVSRSIDKFYNFITFGLPITVILLLNCLVFIFCLYVHVLFLRCYFSFVILSVRKDSLSLYFFTSCIGHGVKYHFHRLCSSYH